jgi:hypothetical protein
MKDDIILDSNELDDEKQKKISISITEKFLGATFLLSILCRDLTGNGVDQPILLCGLLLSAVYLFGNWWLNKPNKKNTRAILVTILYGITSCTLTFALLFEVLYLTGAAQMAIVGFLALAFSLLTDFLAGIKKERILDTGTTYRFGILATLVVLLLLIPDDYKISFTYRKFPGFLKHYEVNKATKEFDDIKQSYFNKTPYRY